jgi:hypothetical protein
VRKKEGLSVSIVAFSPAGHRGLPATGKLKGKMRVGTVPKKKRKRR